MVATTRFARIIGFSALWLVTILVAALFAFQGGSKFFSQSFWTVAFTRWGYPVWFRILVGAAECAAAVLVVIPRLAPYGATLIIAIMTGGIVTHIRAGQPRQIVAEVVWIIMASIIIIARRRLALRRLGKRL